VETVNEDDAFRDSGEMVFARDQMTTENIDDQDEMPRFGLIEVREA
jgi:hypothetical protein